METIKYTTDYSSDTKKIIVKYDYDSRQHRVSCECCDWLIVDFYGASYWMQGSICTDAYGFFASKSQDGNTPCWCEGGFYDGNSSRSHIETNVGAARQDGWWTSSVNFYIKAHDDKECDDYSGMMESNSNRCPGEGPHSGSVAVTYKGVTKMATITLVVAEYGSNCSFEDVGVTITVYKDKLNDGSYFTLL